MSALLVALATAAPARLAAQTLAGETFAGAFVTMTKGAKCPSTATIDFMSQGEANGVLPGMFDGKGTIRLTFDRTRSRVTLDAVTSQFEINRSSVLGEILWDQRDAKPLQITCDDLSMRIEGRVRYRVTHPFVESGFADIRITGSRRVITSPYYGNVHVTFARAR